MNFQFTGSLWVEESDLEKMCDLCRKTHCSPQDALSFVADSWDDCDFYLVGLVEQQIIKEIEKRLTSTL